MVLLQEYVNGSSENVEAKYVFPLDEMSSVYAFEAFINGKHVVGRCREKELAKAEYRAAVAAGHGAYLMEKEEEEDVFTVSVGNLPPRCSCIIQVRLPFLPPSLHSRFRTSRSCPPWEVLCASASRLR